jgi:hypothetical protein
MNTILLDTIPYTPSLPDLMKKLHIKPDSPNASELQAMVHQAQTIARPKAVFKAAFIEVNQSDRVIIDGVGFTSRVLSTNLEHLHRVFPYIATCGLELDGWAHSSSDMLYRFWADAIAESALRQAMKFLEAHLTGFFLSSTSDLAAEGKTPRFARMNPGSLEEWPISEQKPLFSLLGEGPEQVGVRLTESFLMHPVKSVSGIFFSTQEEYANCMLCPREVCPNRQAPYQPGLLEQKYAQFSNR